MTDQADIEVRVGRADDLPAAVALWRRSRAAVGERPPAALLELMAARMAAPHAHLIVGLDQGRVVGLALGEWPPGTLRADDSGSAAQPRQLQVALVVVEPGHRRHGLGTLLLEALADQGYLQGARQLSARSASRLAEDFYRGCGLTTADRGRPEQRWQAELDPPLHDVAVQGAVIRLGQLLKLAGLVDTGSQAKLLLAAGGVQVNGDPEQRRGRQLADGDVVVARDRAVRVVLPTGRSGAVQT